MIDATIYLRQSFTLYFATFPFLLLPLQAAQESKEHTHPRPLLKGMSNLRITINPNDNNMPKNFEDIKIYTEKLLEKGVQPQSILLILDVDGTVTNFSNPTESPNQEDIKARGDSVSFIEKMVTVGVNIVLSSAWPSFEETLQRLKNLHLEEILKIPNALPWAYQDTHMLYNDINIKYCHAGLVASVGYFVPLGFFKVPHYYQKAFAYKLVYPDLNEHTITHVIFGDDNEQPIKDFERDINTLKDKKGLFTSAEVKLFRLCVARGELYLK